MHITTKGQITIPLEIRERYGFLPHCQIEFMERHGQVYLKLVKVASDDIKSRGRMVVEHLSGKATVRMTTDEIMQLTRGEE